jgi:hypothetical protein
MSALDCKRHQDGAFGSLATAPLFFLLL